ncbi:MAG: DUF4835 family protein [Calditrichaeota bacterium]|nr:DUF4835 family protein [Calditrichota bacterium]MCB9368439.1 DUF4835 family protein [Calditrichota bacterium]
MKHTFFIWTAALLLLGATIRPVHGQLLYPEVTVDLQRLPEEAQAKLQGLDSILTRYIEEARQPWNRDAGQYDLPVQISIYFTEYTPNPQEDKFKANLIVTNKRDARYDDKRLEFGMRTPYQPGQQNYDPFFSIIEFYLWIVIANEEDKYEKFGGNPYFDRAKQVQLSSTSSIYFYGWDKRKDLLNELTSDNNKLYREFEFFYHTGIYFDEERQYEDSKAYLHYALLKLELLPIDKRNELLDTEHQTLAMALKNCGYDRGIEALRRMDPSHKADYDEIFNEQKTP